MKEAKTINLKKNVNRDKKVTLDKRVMLIMLILFVVGMTTTILTIFGMFFGKKVKEKRENLVYCAQIVPHLLTQVDYDFSGITPDNLRDYLEAFSFIPSTYNGVNLQQWLTVGKDAEYETVYQNLCKLKTTLDVSDLFVFKINRDASGSLMNKMSMVFDTPSAGRVTYDLGDMFTETKTFETLQQVYETGESALYDSATLSDSGFVLVAYAPIVNSVGEVVSVAGAEVSLISIVISVVKDNWWMMLDEIVDFIFLGLAVVFFIRVRIVKPVNILSSHMRSFVSDEDVLKYSPVTEIHTRDELEQMGDDFNALAARIIRYAENLEEKTASEERMKVDLGVASQIRNIISSETTYPAFPERADMDLCLSLQHTMYNRCSFCKFFFTDVNRLVIIFGEALGSNLASMIFSALSVSYMKSTAKMGFAPEKIAAEVNNNLCSIEKKDDGLTVAAVIADINLKTGEMKYVNAGMPPMLIKRPGESFTTDHADLPFSLGQMRGISFKQSVMQLSQGSTILLTSYGVSEMRNIFREKYTMQRLASEVNEITANIYELDKITAAIEAELEEFREGASVEMDTAILGFRYFG